MLKLKQLIREYNGKQCIGFYTDVVDETKPENDPTRKCFRAFWARGNQAGEWYMQVTLPRTRDADSQVYHFGYQMPRDGLPLELVAATGLKYFQLYLKQEIQDKSNFDFVLGELLKDM